MRAFFPRARSGRARARARSTRQMLSSTASTPLAEVVRAGGIPPWQQLYPTNDWK
jgi:hypothetical protein